jgi:hypothetical protein
VRRIALSIGPSSKHSHGRKLTLPRGKHSVFTRDRIAGLPDGAHGSEPANIGNYVASLTGRGPKRGLALAERAITVTSLTSLDALPH